jgi:hypothetical protein
MTEPDLDLDEQLARLLRATRAATEPQADARARVRSALALKLPSGGATTVAPATRAGLGAKPWLLSALAVAVLIGFVLRGRPDEFWGEPAAVSVVAPLSPPAPAAEPAPPPSAASPPAAAALAPTAASVDVAAAPATAAPAAPSASPGPRASAKAREPADELALVSAMQLALRSGNAAQALALANEHARRFPSGALTQEREGARAIAQCQLAEPTARAAVQSAFEARYPSSPYAARVKAACAR